MSFYIYLSYIENGIGNRKISSKYLPTDPNPTEEIRKLTMIQSQRRFEFTGTDQNELLSFRLFKTTKCHERRSDFNLKENCRGF